MEKLPTMGNANENAHVAKYLGFDVGPNAEVKSWDAPKAKYWSRVAATGNESHAPRERAKDFATKCVAVFSYVAQLTPPPKEVLSLELRALAKIFKQPFNVWTREAYQSTRMLGMHPVPDIEAYAKA